jgi:tripartite-type tricarboxylate transporter receptor subunit TctC
MPTIRKIIMRTIFVALTVTGASSSMADEKFFSEASMKMIVGTGPGGSYDAIGRLVSRHIGKYLPGKPSFAVSNMPGASGLTAANNLYKMVARDGSVIGVLPPEVIFSQLFSEKNVRFDASKFNWIGNPFGSAIVVTVLSSAPVKDWQSATKTESIMGATGTKGPDAVIADLANGTLGTKFRIVTGYKSGHEVGLAMERGEVHGRGAQSWSGWKATNPEWITSGRIVPLFQVALKPLPDLPKVPLLIDLVNGEAKVLVDAYTNVVSMNRPFFTTPDVPKQRVDTLRAAFADMMKDQEFIAQAEQQKIELEYTSGADLQQMVVRTLSLDPGMVKKLQALIDP